MSSNPFPEGNAIVYCEGAFNTTYGKTAHGLVRFTRRYRVLSLVDSHYAGKDAGQVLDGKKKDIPIMASLKEALLSSRESAFPATHLVIGIAPDGGRLSREARQDVLQAIHMGLNVDSGLHDFLGSNEEIARAATEKGVQIRDIRKPPARETLHFFEGKIQQVSSLKIAVLGTDSAIGKRTAAWILVQGLEAAGFKTQLIGTGQTAWMQGVTYGIIMDSLVNDFVSGEIEHALWSAWNDSRPGILVIEGQGSLMNPAYPGGFEILAAGRPDFVILQHAPGRVEYDGFPGYPIQSLDRQIEAIELISGKPVAAISINHENLAPDSIPGICSAIEKETGLPTSDILLDGPAKLIEGLGSYLNKVEKQ